MGSGSLGCPLCTSSMPLLALDGPTSRSHVSPGQLDGLRLQGGVRGSHSVGVPVKVAGGWI